MRNLLLACACVLAGTAMAQTTFPFTLTTADGLPGQTSAAASSFNGWTSPTYTFDEPVSSFRLTVTHTSWQDAFSTSANGSRGYVFFTMGEFYLYDAAGNQVDLTEDNFSSNAAEAASTGDGGGLAALCDGDESTYFHTTYSTPEDNCPKPIGAEFYLEVTLPEPMTSFAFGFQKRSNNANIPSEIIVTKGGVDADPFADYAFQLGDKVDADEIEMGAMYVLSDEAAVTAYEGVTLYPAANLVPGYSSASGQTAYHVRRTPTVDCIFVPVAAGTDDDGKPFFYLRNYLTGTYVKNAAGFEEQAYSFSEAAKLHIVESNGNKFLVSEGGINYTTNSQASFVGYQDNMNRPIYFYKAIIANKYLLSDLQAVIADAENHLATYKEAFADSDEGETAALESALTAAKAITESATGEEINAAKGALEKATAKFLTIQLYLWIDEIYNILETVEFGSDFGNYPVMQKTIMEDLQNQLSTDIDGREFSDLTDVEAYIAKVQKTMDEFYASKVESYSEWPLHLVGEDGAVLFEAMSTGNYTYTSPTFFLEEEVERIYITTVQTNTGDNGGGWPCTNWAHFALYDGNGEQIDLDESNFSTNALETNGDGQGIAGICDYDEDGNPDLTTYLHTLYSSSKPETNEHYICVEFPEPMRVFSFTLISRNNGRLVPTEMVIGPEPYHYVAAATLGLRNQVLTAADIDPNKYYILKGNINVVDQGSTGSGFYSGYNSAGENPQNEGAVQFIPTEDGAWKIHFVVEGYYLSQPESWTSATVVNDEASAGAFFITESENLQDAFKIWAQGEDTKYVLQDWSGSMGYYTVAGEGFENDDTDGESDWTIYETDVPVINVYTNPVTSTSQLNASDSYTMWGNLEVVSKGVEGSGFYSGKDVYGTKATNYTLFTLEAADGGAYKIHYTVADVYLKAPTGWDYVYTTTDAAEAGCFFFKESENLSGAFKIYAEGSFDKDGTTCPIIVLQDWGDSMGSYPIASWSEDDTDGESDWTLYTTGDPSDVVLDRADYMGTYTWTYDNYWDNHEKKEQIIYLDADKDSDDGVVINDFFTTGCPLKGRFDGVAHTISFPGLQKLNSDDTYTYYFRSVSSEDAEIVFTIDLINEQIIYNGQAGFIYHNDIEDTWPYWKDLCYTYIKLVPGDDVKVAPAIEDATIVSTVYYNMGGQAMEAPVQGINIVKTIYDNGTVLMQKILVK